MDGLISQCCLGLDLAYQVMDLCLQFLNLNLNHSIPKKINPEYSLDGLMLKLKLQYFGYLMRRDSSLGKTLKLARIEGRRRKE